MNEDEILRELLRLPREVRQHLFTTYSDAASLFGEVTKMAEGHENAEVIRHQQALYVRISKRLLLSLDEEE